MRKPMVVVGCLCILLVGCIGEAEYACQQECSPTANALCAVECADMPLVASAGVTDGLQGSPKPVLWSPRDECMKKCGFNVRQACGRACAHEHR